MKKYSGRKIRIVMVYNNFSHKWIEGWICDGTEMKGGHTHNHRGNVAIRKNIKSKRDRELYRTYVCSLWRKKRK